jgi:hypothetical protein
VLDVHFVEGGDDVIGARLKAGKLGVVEVEFVGELDGRETDSLVGAVLNQIAKVMADEQRARGDAECGSEEEDQQRSESSEGTFGGHAKKAAIQTAISGEEKAWRES